MSEYDFSGYATKNDVLCSDGRTIRRNAFAGNDGTRVPLVWRHGHGSPDNVLGHALLENREDGVYAYCSLNNAPAGQNAREIVKHGDVRFMSIYANQLVHDGRDVIKGNIREVSLVIAGANPGAMIDNVAIQHDDGLEELDDEAVIKFAGTEIVSHSEEGSNEMFEEYDFEEVVSHEDGEETIGDVFNTLTDKQKDVVYLLLAGFIAKGQNDGDDEAEHSLHGGDDEMYHNLFYPKGEGDEFSSSQNPGVLTHDQFSNILERAKTGKTSLKGTLLAHAATYGIEDIEFLFPNAHKLFKEPRLIEEEDAWVEKVMNGVDHSPFARFKTMLSDMTVEEVRAKGYVKAALKKEQVLNLIKREVDPWTIYQKQKLDRNDIVDITDMNVVAWVKARMRQSLRKEAARAILLSDGRDAEHDDKINESKIRPIYGDAELYVHYDTMLATADTQDLIDEIVRARKYYKGQGQPSIFMSTDILTDMLLLKDGDGHRFYKTLPELASALRVKEIIEVPLMEGISRVTDEGEVDEATHDLLAILVNLKDYMVGTDKGGETTFWDDFDIDYNQYKYLLETRFSGMLVMAKSAIVFERTQSAG
jgi:hypothetical protein